MKIIFAAVLCVLAANCFADADGKPIYPYNMSRRYHGNPVGQLVRHIGEPVATNFGNTANKTLTASVEPAKTTTLMWKADEHEKK